MKILHIAPFNTSGMPIALVQAERKLGHTSRLITLGYDRRAYPEDICLRLPFLDFWGTRLMKQLVSDPRKLHVSHVARTPDKIPIEWRPANIFEQKLVQFREWVWQPRIRSTMRQYDFLNSDIVQLDGGLEFFRDGRTVRLLKERGARIICCYTGSDLRTRGVIPAIDALADLVVTLEFDHLKLHPNIHHIFFPFDTSQFHRRPPKSGPPLIVGHAPTVRAAKGSHIIIPILQQLAQKYPLNVRLIEKLPYAEAIRAKSECDIFVDQIGDLGYGINSLEALALAIPTCSCLASGFDRAYPDHPFVAVTAENLAAELERLITDAAWRLDRSLAGPPWVQKYHNPLQSVRRIHRLLGLPEEGPP